MNIKSPADLLKLFVVDDSKSPLAKNNKEANDISYDENDPLVQAINKKRAEREAASYESNVNATSAEPEELTSIDLPLDYDSLFGVDESAVGAHTDNVDQGLILSLCNKGRVDIEYIASITGRDYKEVISSLRGSIYQNPKTWGECYYKGWETADEYLSGNLVKKWRAAQKANEKYNGYFKENLRALESVFPHPLNPNDIYITLGSPWVPTDIIDDFIEHLLGSVIPHVKASASSVKHDEESGIWEIPNKGRYDYTRFSGWNNHTYGTKRLDAMHIIEKTLNQKTIAIYDEVPSPIKPRSKVKIINQDETLLAIKKQEAIIDEFKKWVWADEKRKDRLLEKYDERYACNKVRHFDGSFLTFPELNPSISLYPYQKDAIARILFTPNTLLAHDVGSGKTYIMIAGGMKLRQTGISRKNLYVVPNNLVSQWRDIFKQMYKNANLLTVSPKDFTPARKHETLKSMRDNDYDAIIIAYSCFDRIELSHAQKAKMIEEKLEANKRSSKRLSSDKFSRQNERLQKELTEEHLSSREETDIFFDELGITTIFLDEAHNYKNVPVDTQIKRVLGISSGGSVKCSDMLDKVHHVQSKNGGRGAVFATGTPITNSVTDVFVMQKYLQNGDLKMLGLASFDGWIGMFAEKHTEFEVDIDTSSFKLATRFSRFHNLPELTSLFASIADFHIANKSVGVPDFNGYTDTITEPCPYFKKYLKEISERADKVRKHKVKRSVDNLLLITTDGRKAALDMRLVSSDPNIKSNGNKVSKCAHNVLQIYNKYPDTAQLIFCDYSTPKKNFNLYDELKTILVGFGVPAHEIEFVHSANSERAREKLFEKVRKGKIRILIGSTFKLGIGVNVQDKLKAIHHLDVPWRPADMIQREGRILRQGNTNDEVYIFRYITEGSFDAYSWQLLETKQRFITSLLSGHLEDRASGDINDTALSYAEIKALAIGNPDIKKRVECANELDKLIILRRESIKRNEALAQELITLPAKIEHQNELITRAKQDYRHIKNDTSEYTNEERREIRESIDLVIKSNAYKMVETEILTYRGFKVVAPTGMIPLSPYVWLIRRGKYIIELADSELGNLVRIDNFIDSFKKHISKLIKGLDTLTGRKEYIEQVLAAPDPYSDKIEELQARLARIDKRLGVDKNDQ